MGDKEEGRRTEYLAHLVARFLNEHRGVGYMASVTGLSLSEHGARATAQVLIYPEEKEQEALRDLSTKERELRHFVGTHARIKRAPMFSFALDLAEKTRRMIEGIEKKKER